MDNPGYIALSRLIAQQAAIEVRANNIANLDTPGFRRSEPLFAQHLARATAAGNGDDGRARFVVDQATWRDPSPGPIRQTGAPLDLAIRGDGYFVVETPEGERLTRAGRFMLGNDGRVVDLQGNVLLGTNGTLTIGVAESDIRIAGDGTLSTSEGIVGRVRVVTADPQALRAEGDSLFALQGEPDPAPNAVVMQGALEGSNVQSVLEMTRMMTELREFQFATQVADNEHERQRSAIDRLLRRG